MITEDYVSFETAKLLNRKGFNEPTPYYYLSWKDIPKHNKDLHEFRNEDLRSACSAPTLQLAMKWLRNVHGLFIHIDVIREASCWLADIQDIKDDVSIYPVKNEFPNYEEACEAAIKYCLENLI